jgi:hypothetical protein
MNWKNMEGRNHGIILSYLPGNCLEEEENYEKLQDS